ncbi:MAG: DUF3604 domain-containing protein [Sandaracinus sp.]|nr:DUF3604 domain-containing protein [Sandaracinus sp.]
MGRALFVVAWLVACGGRDGVERPDLGSPRDVALLPTPNLEPFGHCADFEPTRRPYFGELHVHTRFSLDANLEGTRGSPDDAYRFAKGERVAIPPLDEEGRPTRSAQLDRPLDFAAVTDHAEFLGFVGACGDPTSPAYRNRGCRMFRSGGRVAFGLLNMQTAQRGRRLLRHPACGRDNRHCEAALRDLWAETRNAAERHVDRTEACRFTTFVGYEYTANPFGRALSKVHNLHRNVIFRSGIVPERPIDYFSTNDLRVFWQQLEDECRDGDSGCDAVVIPHNSNLASGMMFRETAGRREPWTDDDLRRREALERLFEIYQHKGASECLPGTLAGDEACDFELVPYDNLESAKVDRIDHLQSRDFLRDAFGAGLRMQRDRGVNAFGYGVIAATDNHLGLPGNVNEGQFVGGGGAGEVGVNGDAIFPDRIYFGGGGLAGVWAEENGREALFRALRRRETFGTSGPRIPVRFFGGWRPFGPEWCGLDERERARVGYERGAAMGATLGAPPEGATPSFAVSAVFDPGTAAFPGARLQRVEIVKGWLDDLDQLQVRVFTVAGDPSDGAALPARSCRSEGGQTTLCAEWSDPEHRVDRPAFYYARVLEVPTCRWTTHVCLAAEYDCSGARPVDLACCDPRLGLNEPACWNRGCDASAVPPDPCCRPDVVNPTIQERAWSSPVWYYPAGWEPAP